MGKDFSNSTYASLGESTSRPDGGSVGIRQNIDSFCAHQGGAIAFTVREISTIDVVTSGAVTETDAQILYSTFFDGCVWFVPFFDSRTETYTSVRSRSNILFDTIIIIGARACHGGMSKQYQDLYPILRQHTSDLVLRLSAPGQVIVIEDIQALLVIAAYSDSGSILCDVAVRASLSAHLPAHADDNLAALLHAKGQNLGQTSITPETRTWYYVYVLDMILSLDGGKPTSIVIQPSSARRIRALAKLPQSTAPDVRLFAQVELNAIRCAAHSAVNVGHTSMDGRSIETALRSAALDLDLWLSEWQALVSSLKLTPSEDTNVQLNLQIQHAWAILVLHLRCLTVSGIENIALMTDDQRYLAIAAKNAAERHLQLIMTTVDDGQSVSQRPYVAGFRYAMEFVCAKNAFCVLIVLRLSVLLGDPVGTLMNRLFEAKSFLAELAQVGMSGNLSYTRILSQVVDKCERAIAMTTSNGNGNGGASEADFETFVPKEFIFEWDFPGIHLHYIPLDWQDLLFDIGLTT